VNSPLCEIPRLLWKEAALNTNVTWVLPTPAISLGTKVITGALTTSWVRLMRHLKRYPADGHPYLA